MDSLRAQLESYQPELTAIRRDLHAYPEIGFEEVRTSRLVAAKLREWGVEVTEGIAGTGVVGTVRGDRPGPRSVGIRADMDALPIQETTGLAYASTIPGRMHACGHDGHTAMLLGAARYLSSHRDFAGTVHLIFQPAEEGLGGAPRMLKEGLFERFPCDQVFGLHNMPGYPLGSFETKEGAVMAASSTFGVTFRGKGGHAGILGNDPYDLTTVQARFILGLANVVSKELPPGEVAVARVGEVAGHGGMTLNVMPSTLFVGGTVRTFNPEVHSLIHRRIEEIARVEASHAEQVSVEVRLRTITVALMNRPEQTKASLKAAGKVAGARLNPHFQPITAGEDFAYMIQERPGTFMFLGTGVSADGQVHPLHTPKYDFNDAAIPFGVEYWVRLVQQELAG
jgi:hippurate hydrolase